MQTERSSHIYTPETLFYVERSVAERVSERYAYITHQIVDVGETMLRTTTRNDIDKIKQIKETDYLDTSQLDSTMNSLRDIMGGHGGRTSMLSKVLAMDAYYDLWRQSGYIQPDFEDFFNELVLAEPDNDGRVILYGAFYAKRLLELSGKNVSSDQVIQQIDSMLVGSVNSEQSELRRIAIHSAGYTLAQMLDSEQLHLGLPWTIIHHNEEEKSSIHKVGGYPESVMFLHVNKLPTKTKLLEATVYGVPQVSGVNTYRCLRVMVGEEIPDDSEQYISQATKRLIKHENRRFTYVYIPSLLVPNQPISFSFDQPERFSDDYQILENSSFDAVSFWVACRASDRLEDSFPKIHFRYKDKQDAKAAERQKNAEVRSVDRVVNSIIDSLFVEYDRTVDGTKKTSIISVAMADSGIRIQSNEELDNIRAYILNNVKSFVLRYSNGNWHIRNREQIGDLFRVNVWKELPKEDKVQFGKFLLYPGSKHYNAIGSEAARNRIEQTIVSDMPLDSNDSSTVSEIGRQNVVLRCETLRNTYEPEAMRRLRLMNSPEDDADFI